MALVNLIGRTFGMLKVVARGENKGEEAAWVCECKCGGSATIRGGSLRDGDTRSCGCLKATKWSDEQIAIIKADYPNNVCRDEIAAKCNRLPGKRVSGREVNDKANRLGLKRPLGFAWRAKPRSYAPSKPVVRKPEAPKTADIEAWIAQHGVKKLPAAACGVTTATIPEEDRIELQKYRQRQDIAWSQKYQQRVDTNSIAWKQAAGLAQRAKV